MTRLRIRATVPDGRQLVLPLPPDVPPDVPPGEHEIEVTIKTPGEGRRCSRSY